ncbi:hypothetical protein GT755_00030 [Herbidospora sp. NEAU-GS84]|uniref:Uncharacterized protein n=1 Tax=Herbidospora solisilvae TaxID=2696284 RepID=A0A7C9MY26_9ACTN|nr:hypothetical protein [Herbidospora solisilvae]NAS20069.1 hypothetical protein [Herbidospora solisilvae]
MEQSLDRSPHTLAQLARRAGISEGRARALATATPSGLPRPDGADADGRPLWSAATIDAWCARTGRKVSEDSLWLFRAPPAAGPAPELQRRIVTLPGSYRDQAFYVIVWDTEHGHLIYLQPLDDTGGAHKDWLAKAAAELIHPRWWADAVVVMPQEKSLSYLSSIHDLPETASVYRLFDRYHQTDPDPDEAPGVFGGLRRWISRTGPSLAGPRPISPADADTKWKGQMDLTAIAAVVGRPIPLWVNDTATTDNAQQTLSYDRTFITPDTVTQWPAAQERLARALQVGMAEEFPAAFAALAADAAEGLREIRAAHEHLADTGPGWYLVCRPARPAPSFEVEQLITAAQPVTDPDQVSAELTRLRAIEGELDLDDPRGEVYEEAITLLAWQLRTMAKQAGRIRDSHAYVPVADDGLLRFTGPWQGPVVEAWRKTLTPVPDPAAALRLRRVQRLIADYPADGLQNIYRDSEGRYILVTRLSSGQDHSLAEWPAGLQVTAHWTDKTVIAGDDELGSTTTLLALTPTSEGRMRIDPVPMLPHMGSDAFAYGYGGGTPSTTYRALLRCALGDTTELPWSVILHGRRGSDDTPASQLWTAISTTKGPLRLSWPQLKLWARADKNHTTT